MEEALVSVIERLMQSQWKQHPTESEAVLDDLAAELKGQLTSKQMTLLHLASSLGYTRLVREVCID